MSVRTGRLLLALTLTLGSFGAFASSEDPIMARGFSPETMYQFGNLDSINLFNGNLNVAIPIGQPYSVTSHFGYQLMLSYNSKVWDLSAAAYGTPGFCTSPLGYFFIPNRKSNAGMAWSLGYGRLFPGCHPSNEGQDIAYLTFESPDGASHAFTYTTDGGNTYYTSDSSHLRVRNYQSSVVSLDFPDGTVYTYAKNGCDEWLLSSMTDSDGNSVSVGWDPPHDTQTLTDPYGRKTVIHYADAAPNDVYDRVISSVDVPVYSFGTSSPDTAKATYSFEYSYPRLDIPMATAECAEYTFVTPMLTKVTRPDLSTFEFEYGYYSKTPDHKGSLLVSMTLPTKGQIQWDYDSWPLPGPSCQPETPWALAVKERKFYDPFHDTTDSWKYTSELDPGPFDNDGNYCPPLSYYPLILGQWPKEQKRTTVVDPKGDKSVHYFSVWQGRSQYDNGGDIKISPNGYNSIDYGLSMSKFFPPANGAFLSIRQYDCGGTGNCDDAHPDRSTYMLYEHHRPAGHDDVKDPFDVTTQRKRTVYDKDITPTGAAYVEVSSSDYDGYGHYRVVTTSGNFGLNGSVQSRSITTNYNGVDSEVGLPSTHTDIRPGSGTWGVDFTPYASTEKWILGTFTSVVQSENSHSVKQLFLFDRNTGFLKRTRLRRGVPAMDGLYTDSGNDTHDLITVYEPSVYQAALQAAGDVGAETHYGGDKNLLPNSGAALADINLSSSTGIRSTTTYRYGSASTATIDGAPYSTLNVTVDRNTGFPRSVTDPAGHVTSFEYDNMSRISKQTMPSGTVQDYLYLITDHAYAVSSMHAPNSVDPILNSTYTFDAFGRVSDVKDLMADGTARGRTTTWNVLGQKLSETAPAASGSTGVQTTYTYDAFGRPLSIVPPDGSRHATTYQYDGARAMTVTAGQATGGIGKSLDGSGNVVEQPTQIAKEEYDSFTRLSKMTEWGKNGAATTGSYTYDINGHLSGATVTAPEGSQTRSFIYDNRGYLVSQSHPETGTTTFQDYDAFGHAGRRIAGTAGGPFDLTFKYDVYQRLNEIYQGTTLLKKITFDALAAGDPQGSYSQPGQIVKTYRRNDHSELGGDVAVNTYFTYDSAGRLYEKKTAIGSGPLFTQRYGYDDINDVTSLEYPSCSGCAPLAAGASIPSRTISFNWSHGYLTGIDEGTNHFTSATAGKLISYWPNGLLKSITHVAKDNTHEVTDSQALDQGMARPSTITFTGVSAPTCMPPSATITAPSSIAAGGSATASVPVTAGASYLWTIQNGTITSGSGTSTITFTASCGVSSVVLNVTVSTTCSNSGSKTVAVTGGSTATATVFGTQTITQGGSAQLWLSLTGTEPWNVTWSDGYVMSNISGITTVPRVVSPSTTTTYSIVSVTDAFGCGTFSGQPAVVTVSGTCTPTDPTINAPASVAAGQTFSATYNSPSNVLGASFGVTNGTFLGSSTTGTTTTATVRANCSGTVVLTRSITGGATTCSSSSTKSVNIIQSSAFVSGSQTISPNNPAIISASLSGTAPWSITWSDGYTQSNLTSSFVQRTVYPASTTTYTVTAVSDGVFCSGTSSGSAVVTVSATTPPTPTGVSAARRAGQNIIDVSWNSTGADYYLVERTFNNGPVSEFTAFGNSFMDADSVIATNGVVTYVYYVIGVKNGVRSLRSVPDIATFTTFTDDPLTPNETVVAGYHVSELRQAIDAVRRSAGLSLIWGTYPPATGPVYAWAFYEQSPTSPPRDMFNAVNQARQQLGMATIGFWGDTPVTGASIVITQINTLRNGVK